MAESKKNEKKNPKLEMVDVTFPKERGVKGQQEIVIIVNGKAWHIIKGVKVRVPRYVLIAFDNNEKNRDEAEAYIIENASK